MPFTVLKKSRLLSYGRFIGQLPGYLRRPVTPDEARAAIRGRLKRRNENFLELVKESVFDHPASPYAPLLRTAGCEYGDLVKGVEEYGLEGMLQRLQEAGVRVSLDEFKGRKPIQRGNGIFRAEPHDFDNPYLAGSFGVSTGGTSGGSARTRFDLDFLAARSCYDRVMLDMLDLDQVPMALWYPALPASTGIANTLRYAKAGYVPDRWFNMLVDSDLRVGLESRLATNTIIRLGRWIGCPLPRPEPVPLDRIDRVVDHVIAWLKERGRCAFQSYVSQAVRVAGACRERCPDLSGLVAIVGSEPLTVIKRREIEKTGAKVYHRYAATEVGTIAMGCANPSESDDVHLMSDMVAAVQAKDTGPEEAGPLFFSSLHKVMPKIMINVQLGDSARVHEWACGCEFEKLGFHTHLSMVRSHERFTSQGMAVPSSSLERAVDEVLTAKYGGTSLDYQWVELEDKQGRTGLKLRISPDLGSLDEAKVVHDVLEELRKGDEGERMMSDIWQQSGVLSVVREFPKATQRGKRVPMLKESS